jgi:hypothetical protein
MKNKTCLRRVPSLAGSGSSSPQIFICNRWSAPTAKDNGTGLYLYGPLHFHFPSSYLILLFFLLPCFLRIVLESCFDSFIFVASCILFELYRSSTTSLSHRATRSSSMSPASRAICIAHPGSLSCRQSLNRHCVANSTRSPKTKSTP